MTHLERALIRLDADLKALHIHWALIGGLAVSIRAEPRTTRDVDVVVAVSGEQEAERIALALKLRGYTEQPSAGVLEQKDVGRLAGVRLLVPDQDAPWVGVDLLFASSGVEPEIVAAAELLEIRTGLFLPVARRGHLLALKVLAGRDKDRMDAHSLLEYADSEDRQLARETLVLIERRGYHRGIRLLIELAKLEVTER